MEISIKLSSGILVVILNIAEIIFIVKPKHRKRIYEINLASLSVADCLFSLSFTIISSISLLKLSEKKLLETTCIASVFCVLVSVFHLIFIAVDEIMIFLIPFQYETIFNTKREKIRITLLLILAFAISIIIYTSNYTYKSTIPKAKLLKQFDLNRQRNTPVSILSMNIKPLD